MKKSCCVVWRCVPTDPPGTGIFSAICPDQIHRTCNEVPLLMRFPSPPPGGSDPHVSFQVTGEQDLQTS